MLETELEKALTFANDFRKRLEEEEYTSGQAKKSFLEEKESIATKLKETEMNLQKVTGRTGTL